jgi:hypothetical protein
MRAFPVADFGPDKSLALVSTRTQDLDSSRTKRVAELEARVARLRAELEETEAELEREKTRLPVPGDFVRCPLTNFFGRVTKVTPRASGRPWIEIIPYLGPDLPGHSTMDLFDSWELIDPPSHNADPSAAADGSLRMPTIAPFMPASHPALSPPAAQDDLEVSFRRLWMPSGETSS